MEVAIHVIAGFTAFLLIAPIVLNYGERARRRGNSADLRARAQMRVAQREAMPYDEERRS